MSCPSVRLNEVMIVGTRRGPTVVGPEPFESEAVPPVEFKSSTATRILAPAKPL
jgi:hypothetical protein